MRERDLKTVRDPRRFLGRQDVPEHSTRECRVRHPRGLDELDGAGLGRDVAAQLGDLPLLAEVVYEVAALEVTDVRAEMRLLY